MPGAGTVRTFADRLRPLAADRSGGFAFVDSARRERYFCFADLHAEATRRAGLLRAAGFRRGDRIGLVAPDEAEMVLGFLGMVLAGLVPVLIAPRHVRRTDGLAPAQLDHILATSGAAAILADPASAADLEGRCGAARLLRPEAIFAAGRTAPIPDEPDADPDAPCFLQYTSGSTGRPKGTIVTHRNLLAATALCADSARRRDGAPDHVVSWLPLYHDLGLIGFCLSPLAVATPATLLSPGLFARRPKAWLEAIAARGATITGAPNFAFDFVLRRLRPADVEGLDLRSLRVLFCGAEPIRLASFEAFAERLHPAGFDPDCFMPCYGLAEATLAVSIHPRDEPTRADTLSAGALREGQAKPAAPGERARVVVSCGPPVSGHAVEIVDERAVPLPEGRVGEIRVRGPAVSPGYFGDPAATAESWRDGWLMTGDLGYLRDGRLHVCGRVKDLVIVRGGNYHPQELEWAAERVEGLRGRIAAFPIDRDGDEAFAVVAEAPAGSDREALAAAVAEAITREIGVTPADVRIVPPGTVPLTTSGKVQRRQVRTAYEAGALPGAFPMPSPGMAAVQ
ncbi:MAG: fatty acyl-AMP ligase [Alphaproteobacteria bacterium]